MSAQVTASINLHRISHTAKIAPVLFFRILPTTSEQQLANRSQSTNSVGVRWDFMKNFDFKAQYDRITVSDNSNGYLINVPANLILYGTTFHVINAVVDFVF